MTSVRIKICGLFRDEDIEYVNEAGPDYIGFVFAESRRRVSPAQAARLRRKLADGIVPVGVFVNAPEESIAALYRDGIIGIAQLHGAEDDEYIARLKNATGVNGANGEGRGILPIPVIKVFRNDEILSPDKGTSEKCALLAANSDYYLIDSGAGSGKTFDWNLIDSQKLKKPWFLAGGINIENIARAMALAPFAVDLSGGAETDGVKDREKIMQLTAITRRGSVL